MHVNWKHVAVFLGVLPFAAILFAWIGFFNVGASSGHWRITDWFLHFAMRSAVRTYALAVDVPEELPRSAIQPAAGHYAKGCAMCHGAPGETRSPPVLRMLPQPPDLARTVGEWTDAQLFRIVKHGIRFTGMPAWPAQARDDEVWAMVAFLRELPAMTPEAYRGLAYGPHMPAGRPAGLDQSLVECARCHGETGEGRSPSVPVIAGQKRAYLLASLRAYARGERPSGIMGLAASGIADADLAALARHFASLPRPPARATGHAAGLAADGEAIARSGIPTRGVPACLGCHERPDRNPAYPNIAGQPADYLRNQLSLLRAGKRRGTPYSHIMTNVARELTDREIEALAAFFSGGSVR
ncbi:MAG: c-type cytochrome [Parvibaculaceae bacterium]